jgi:hypothetical protein
MTAKQSLGRQETCSRICGNALASSRGRGPRDDAFRARVREGWDAGKTAGEIAKGLHVTKNVVVGVVRRLNLATRPSSRWPSGYVGKYSRSGDSCTAAKRHPGTTERHQGTTERQPGTTKNEKIAQLRCSATRRKTVSPSRERLTAPHITHPVVAKIEAAKVKTRSPIRVISPPGEGCQFPISENPWLICDEPRTPRDDGRRSSYCAEHHQLCWVKVRHVRQDAAA